MATGLQKLGEHAEAEEKLREVLGLLEARHGDASARLLAPCAELAKVLAAQGRHAESHAFLARAQALPDLKPQQLESLGKLAKDLAA